MKKNFIVALFVMTVSLLITACGGGASSPAVQQLVVTSSGNTFAANIGESATITYQILLKRSLSCQQYKANIVLPNNQFSIESNGCVTFYDTKGCNVVNKFSPIDQRSYSNYNLIKFIIGALESSVNAITVSI